jgi:hypothetical protein
MKLDKKLNIVIPIDSGWVHATPISYPVFEKYFMPISKAFSRVFQEGLGTVAGPRVAYLLLRKVSEDLGIWETPEGDGVKQGLMNEIIRLSNVIVIGDKGYETHTLYDALKDGILGEEEKSEVLNALVFFTLVSSMHKKAMLDLMLLGMTKFWGGLTTSLDSTAYLASLPMLTQAGSSGEKVIASHIPS